MSDFQPNLGQLVDPEEGRRDAIHVAVLPVVCETLLTCGEEVRLSHRNDQGQFVVVSAASTDLRSTGIVDPFLREGVRPGESFWMMLHPKTSHSLRHVWSHPHIDEVNRRND